MVRTLPVTSEKKKRQALEVIVQLLRESCLTLCGPMDCSTSVDEVPQNNLVALAGGPFFSEPLQTWELMSPTSQTFVFFGQIFECLLCARQRVRFGGKQLTEPQVFVFSDHAVSTQTCQHGHMIKNLVKCLESQVPGAVDVCKVGT